MTTTNKVKKVVIMGAAGRDFHNFNMVYRDDPDKRVIAFTAAQIPDIAGRRYPGSLAGAHYPEGIPIVEESSLSELCRREAVDQVVFAYSDVSHAQVMQKASIALAAGADFILLGPEHTMLQANVPVIAICAVRTGCGKSQTTRWLAAHLKESGLRVAVIRHPMPYGELEHQAVQRFASRADLDAADCTIEEREEYEPHLAMGTLVYAGVDYARIVAQAEQEADILLWDGGNNDYSFIRPDLNIVLVDPLRAGHETSHYPGETVLRMADIVLVGKTNSAADADIQTVSENVSRINPSATLVRAASPVTLEDSQAVIGKRVLVVEDGPSITHGGMPYGAGYVAATEAQAAHIVDPRGCAVPSIHAVYEQYPHIAAVLPALGYHAEQLAALQASINASDAELVVSATPCDLGALIDINKPIIRARYEFAEIGTPGLGDLVDEFLGKQKPSDSI
jgi:predicted GTPase